MGLGILFDVEEIFGLVYFVLVYIFRIFKFVLFKNKVFVIGEVGIEYELRSENVFFIGGIDFVF